jgi:multisubunit Na+/H+ antiporter MnhG subunit
MAPEQQFVIEIAKTAMWALLIVSVPFSILGAIAFFKTQNGAAKSFSLLIHRSNALQLLTVLIIIITAFVLTVLDKIDSQAIVSILSSIAAYVLGRASHKNDEELLDKTSSDKKPTSSSSSAG